MLSLIIFDWKRTLYDLDAKELIEGSLDLLESIKNKNISMILVGKGGEDMNVEVDRLGIRDYFNDIVFAQGDKDSKVFAKFVKQPESTLFIGDRVRSELEIGNQLGAMTIWVKQGKFASEEPLSSDQKPDYIVSSLKDCSKLISSLD